ncbi:DUF6194 family protein [Nocardia sp. NPDC101769]|uniref:DUF6194 family protein n=1 Tax=Nocardia sp. NPDC101769 TaxID=3364333 RepID=UPI003819CBF8
MTIEDLATYIESLGGVLTLHPAPGDGTPEIAWGDYFFYYAPDGVTPTTVQPFATLITKDYPDDTTSRLDRPDAFRLNINTSRDEFIEWTGHTPRESGSLDPSATDTLIPHPIYASAAWLAVVNPGPRTEAPIRNLLRNAHDRARARYDRRPESD